MTGILYGVGVGPGDPQLLTLKAVEIIEKCNIIAAPNTGRGENTALQIVKDYIGGKEILKCDTPMTKNEDILNQAWQVIADDICRCLDNGRDVCFVTLGDPTVYATYMYIHRLVVGKGYQAQLIPGITSFCAVAAALGVSLCEGAEPLHIIPSSYGDTAASLSLSGTKVLMKSGKHLQETIALLREKNMLRNSAMVERCTMAHEKIYKNLELVDLEAAGYFSTIVVKEE